MSSSEAGLMVEGAWTEEDVHDKAQIPIGFVSVESPQPEAADR